MYFPPLPGLSPHLHLSHQILTFFSLLFFLLYSRPAHPHHQQFPSVPNCPPHCPAHHTVNDVLQPHDYFGPLHHVPLVAEYLLLSASSPGQCRAACWPGPWPGGKPWPIKPLSCGQTCQRWWHYTDSCVDHGMENCSYKGLKQVGGTELLWKAKICHFN